MIEILIEAARRNVLTVVLEGEFELEDAQQNFLAIVTAIEKHDSEKILVDGRAIHGDPTIIERFYYGEFVAEAVRALKERYGNLINYKFAYVLHEPTLDPLRFGETVAVNRHMYVKTFDNLDDAGEWLRLKPGETEDFREEGVIH